MTAIAATAVPPGTALRGTRTRLWLAFLMSVGAILATSRLARLFGLPVIAHYLYPIWSLLVAPAMGYGWVADYLLRPLTFRSANRAAGRLLGFTMALIPLSLLYGLIGFVAGNPLRYVAGDTFKYLLTPLGFYLAAVGIGSLPDARWLLRGIGLFGLYPGLDIGSHLFALTYLYGRKAVYWKRYRWLLLLPVVYLTIRANRTSLLLVPFLTIVLYYYARRFRLWHLAALVIVVAALGVGLYRVAPDLVTSTGAYEKTVAMVKHLNLEDYRKLDPSTYQRLQEAVLVEHKFARASWFERVFGFGSGALYRVTELPPSIQYFLEEVQGGYAHHIHFAPVFVYHQWGLPGVALLGYSTFALLMLGWSLARRRREVLDPERRERYSLQLSAYLMALAFFLYAGWNSPKISLFYFGLVLGVLWRLLGSSVDPVPTRPRPAPAAGLHPTESNA